MSHPATIHEPQPRSSIGRRIGTGFGIGIGVIVFSLVVWLAFSLGFSRLEADLTIEMKTALEATPEVRFDAMNSGWERVQLEGDDESSPQYVNVTEAEDTPCMFSWQVGRYDSELLDVPDDMHDLAASEQLLDQLGYTGFDATAVQVETTGELTVELIYAQQEMEGDVTVATAARAFTGSQHYVVFFLTCDDANALNPGLMMSVFDDVKLDISPVE